MAKPIPVNRRWIENQKRSQQAGANPPSRPNPPPAPRGVNHREALRELLAALGARVNIIQEEDLEDPFALDDDTDLNDELDLDDEDDLWLDDDESVFEEDAPTPESLYQAHAPHPEPRVIAARYEQTCTGCGRRIRIGDRITQHPVWGDWVHEACRTQQQRITRYTLQARYPGYCAACRRPIEPGQQITRIPLRGWIHAECAP